VSANDPNVVPLMACFDPRAPIVRYRTLAFTCGVSFAVYAMSIRSVFGSALACVGLVLMSGSAARSDTIIYAGYYDLSPPSYGNPNPLPSPWVGSPNTAFFGDTTWAVTSEPDTAAVRIENTGPLSITLQAATIGGYTAWDSFIGAGYPIAPGQNVIFSQTTTQFFDGSEKGLVASLISLTWDGVTHNFTDTASILHGFSGENETLPWT
jgi:hypothetical protein